MSDEVDVTGAFASEEECVHAIRTLHAAGLEQMRAFAPFPCEHILEAQGRPRSWVRLCVLLAGISGVICGFWLTIGTVLSFPHVVGGKPLISIPPFVIIAFELMILFGGLTALVSFLFFAKCPDLTDYPGYSTRFTSDEFGLVVRCKPADAGRVETMMRDAGAAEIKREAA